MEHEPIWMDGVDVKNCKGIDLSLSPLVKCKSLKFKTSDGGIAGIWCSDHTNCYFKQLARKTQECEELEEKLACQININNHLADYQVTANKLMDYYRKALVEIKEIIATSLSDDHDPAEGLYGEMVQILDIINKVKRG